MRILKYVGSLKYIFNVTRMSHIFNKTKILRILLRTNILKYIYTSVLISLKCINFYFFKFLLMIIPTLQKEYNN